MTKIKDIEEGKGINLRNVTIKKIGDTRFVKTKFDKQKDEKDNVDWHFTGVREITIKDDSGEIKYTEWSPKDDVEVGDELRFIKAEAKFDTYSDEFKLSIRKNDGGLCINDTALEEGRDEGNYLRKDGNSGGSTGGTTKKKKSESTKIYNEKNDEINISLDIIIRKIVDQTDLSLKEVGEKIKGRVNKLNGLLTETGAALILADDLKVDLEKETPKREDPKPEKLPAKSGKSVHILDVESLDGVIIEVKKIQDFIGKKFKDLDLTIHDNHVAVMNQLKELFPKPDKEIETAEECPEDPDAPEPPEDE